MDPTSLVCPKCQAIASPGSKFCANCGFAFVQEPTSLSVGRQIWIYFVSIFLPPLGLIWTFKYFKSQNQTLQNVAIIALVLTVLSTIVTIWVSIGIFQTVQQQLNTYQNLGI